MLVQLCISHLISAEKNFQEKKNLHDKDSTNNCIFCVLVITIQQKQVSASFLPLKSLKFDFFAISARENKSLLKTKSKKIKDELKAKKFASKLML